MAGPERITAHPQGSSPMRDTRPRQPSRAVEPLEQENIRHVPRAQDVQQIISGSRASPATMPDRHLHVKLAQCVGCISRHI